MSLHPNFVPSSLHAHQTIKWGYAVSSVLVAPRTWADVRSRLSHDTAPPRAGDVIVAEILEIGAHSKIDRAGFDQTQMFPGDLVGLAVGPRYATRHLTAIIPQSIDELEFVGQGGVAGKVIAVPPGMDGPTKIKPLGYLLDHRGQRVRLSDYAPTPTASLPRSIPMIAVVGASMDGGKTTTAASLVRGLSRAGHRVAAAKITGTASCKDVRYFRDAGAVKAIDFTAAGCAVTAGLEPAELWRIAQTVFGLLAEAEPEAVIFEIADGINQAETHALLERFAVEQRLDGVLYACTDALSVAPGVARIRELGLPIMAVSGMATATPLARTEAAAETYLPVLTREELMDAGIASRLGIAMPHPIANGSEHAEVDSLRLAHGR